MAPDPERMAAVTAAMMADIDALLTTLSLVPTDEALTAQSQPKVPAGSGRTSAELMASPDENIHPQHQEVLETDLRTEERCVVSPSTTKPGSYHCSDETFSGGTEKGLFAPTHKADQSSCLGQETADRDQCCIPHLRQEESADRRTHQDYRCIVSQLLDAI